MHHPLSMASIVKEMADILRRESELRDQPTLWPIAQTLLELAQDKL